LADGSDMVNINTECRHAWFLLFNGSQMLILQEIPILGVSDRIIKKDNS
jgi:hypothetical protein